MHSIFNETAVRAEQNELMAEVEGDYRVDGILYCGKCNTPKELSVPGFPNESESKIVRTLCQCAAAKVDAESEARKRQQKRMRNEEWMSDLEELGAVCVPYATFSQSDQRDEALEFEARTYAK